MKNKYLILLAVLWNILSNSYNYAAVRKLIHLAIAVLLHSFVLTSCSKKKAVDIIPVPRLNSDSLNLGYMYVEQAYRYIGKDSVDLFEIDPIYRIFQNRIFLLFPPGGNGPIFCYRGSEFLNTVIEGPARTFSLRIKELWPSGLTCEWNEEKGTLVVKSEYTSSLIPLIIPERSAYLDPVHSKIVHSLAAARAANQSGAAAYVTFVYEDIDPKLGKVTYKLKLKQVFRYTSHTDWEGYTGWFAFY